MTAAQVETAASVRAASVDGPVWFVPPIGFIAWVNPYAVLGVPEGTRHADIVAIHLCVDARCDPCSLECGAAAILADPVRRLAWHLLQCPDKPPAALTFARLNGKARRECAAYLLDQALRRELRRERERQARRAGKQAPRDDALDELWREVHRAFAALASRKDVVTELSALAVRLGMNEPDALARKVLRRLRNLLPTLHALLFATVEAPDRQAFHWAEVPDKIRHTPFVRACLRQYARTMHAPLRAKLDRARRAAEKGDVADALRRYLLVHRQLDKSDTRLRSLVAFEIGTVVMRMRPSLSSLNKHQILATLELLRSIADAFPSEPRLYAVIGTLHARLAAHAMSFGELQSATEHMLRAGIYDPDSDFTIELDDDAILHLNAAGVRWAVSGPDALKLFAVLNYESSASLADECNSHLERLRIARKQEQERRRRADWAHLALRLDLDGEKAIVAASTLVVELLVGRERGEVFEVTRHRIETLHPELSGVPWAHIEIAVAGDAPVSPGALASALPVPPAPFTQESDPDADLIALAAKRLSEHAAKQGSRWREAPPTFVYPWLFSLRQPMHKLAAAAGVVLIFVGLDRLSVEAWNGHRRDAAYEDLCAAAAGKNIPAVAMAARRFLSLTPPEVFDYRTLDVLESHSGALLREMTRAALEHRQADVTRLLAEAKAIEERASTEETTWRRIEEAQ